MVNRHTAQKIRKTHRYLGVFLGLQFLLWTISGLYFSWTNIDDIRGNQFKNKEFKPKAFTNLIDLKKLNPKIKIATLQLKEIDNKPYYWINNKHLYNAKTGKIKENITKEEALAIAKKRIKKDMKVKDIQLITKTNKHHEYRGGLLPAYVISYNTPSAVKSYISKKDGTFRTIRHRSWRWFDFLWMTHTMDYEGRDNFNTTILRIFSVLGLVTVLSGFLLWFISSSTIRKINKNK